MSEPTSNEALLCEILSEIREALDHISKSLRSIDKSLHMISAADEYRTKVVCDDILNQ